MNEWKTQGKYEVYLENDYKGWHFNNQWHREDGPAREWSSGSKEWFLNGKYYEEQGHKIEMRKRKLALLGHV